MIDATKPITRNYKVACGWNFLVNFVEEHNHYFLIHGLVFDGLNNKLNITWDENGFPMQMEKYPTYYYLRLIPL